MATGLFGVALGAGNHTVLSRRQPRYTEVVMVILGAILLLIGFVAKIAIVWTLGIIVLVVGAVLAIAGTAGREIGGRRHWY